MGMRESFVTARNVCTDVIQGINKNSKHTGEFSGKIIYTKTSTSDR